MSFREESVVQGEAIESDDEFEAYQKISNYEHETSEYQGTVFSGEAPESDDEIFAFSNVKLGTDQNMTESSPTNHKRREPFEGNSVLQKILVDRNYSFWNNLNQTIQHTVVTASSQILAAEELLIQSQLKIQAASRSIKQANETADEILIKCQDILTSEFLPDIKIPT
ncbi:uncharacterized protein LOC116349893 [Contarinia nasturtii]|uniref:uncharacterized protein LOC116349893 n=1 Tax=Contarinia nasturtii TaxID=265458 RepID=UPI0012D49FFD|nr:uncharacterized protein LOC116349893 [Contarinia nasturtii]